MATLRAPLGQRRSTMEIVYEVLKSCSNGGVKKTSIMYHSSLNHHQLQKYIRRLSDRRLIESDEGGRFCLTPEGQKAFDQVKTVMPIIQD